MPASLVEPDPWRPHVPKLQDALRFLTGDIWRLSLHGGALAPLPRTRRVRRARVSGDCVCLLSGGMDSLVGAIDLVRSGRRPILVSQVAKGDTNRQATFARAIDPTLDHVQLSHAATIPGPAERSQRARSIAFLAFGALAASSRGARISIVVPENGFISYNVPLTALRVGSLSTRTTHPYFLRQIQEVWDAVGMGVQLENPYQHRTKGEMLTLCADQELLGRLAATSTSCGRFGRFGYRHCGRCVPCLVRRAAFLAWGQADATDYHFSALGGQHAFDDVRSVAMACLEAEQIGVQRWARGALSAEYVDDADEAVDLVSRGLAELRSLLRRAGVL